MSEKRKFGLIDKFGTEYVIEAEKYSIVGVLADRVCIFLVDGVPISEFNGFSAVYSLDDSVVRLTTND